MGWTGFNGPTTGRWWGSIGSPDLGTPGTESNRIEWSRAAQDTPAARWDEEGVVLIPGLRLEHILAGRDDYGTLM